MIRCRADVPSMGSHHDSRIAYWDHEPRSNVALIINGLRTRFMESPLFEIDLLTGHEPGEAGGLRLGLGVR